MSAKVIRYQKIFAKYAQKIDLTLFDKVEILKEIQTLPIDIAIEIDKYDTKCLNEKNKQDLRIDISNAMWCARVNSNLAIEIGKFYGKYYKQRNGDLKWLFDMKEELDEQYEDEIAKQTDDDMSDSDFDGYDSEASDVFYEDVISLVDRNMQKYQ